FGFWANSDCGNWLETLKIRPLCPVELVVPDAKPFSWRVGDQAGVLHSGKIPLVPKLNAARSPTANWPKMTRKINDRADAARIHLVSRHVGFLSRCCTRQGGHRRVESAARRHFR